MLEVSRNTWRGQSSHCMSGIGRPQRRCVSTEPSGRLEKSMPTNLRGGGRTNPYLHAAMRPCLGCWKGSPTTPSPGAATGGRKKAKSGGPPTQGGREGRPCARGGLTACSCRLLSPESWAAARGGRRGGWWEKARDEMPPLTNRFRLYAGHRGRKGETRVFPCWGQDFAAPPKNFCGPGRDAGSDRASFSISTRILAVILRVGAGCGVC